MMNYKVLETEMKLLWSRDYETGNETVDDQHKEIFRLVQMVLDAESFNGRREKIDTALKFLSEYAVEHFAAEEALMIECVYPEYNEHKLQHDNFVFDVVEFMGRFVEEGSTLTVSETINNFVVVWLKEHIMGSDKAMASYYKEWAASKNAE